MKYASYLYYLLYPYLMLLSQYPIHTAYKNMMQTYDIPLLPAYWHRIRQF